MNPKYLVRPDDFHIFSLDKKNGRYRSYSTKNVRYYNGRRPSAQSHFTLKNLTQNYRFFAIKKSEIQIYEKKHKEYCDHISRLNRSDGHGGIKGYT